jgi:hypothetical protein
MTPTHTPDSTPNTPNTPHDAIPLLDTVLTGPSSFEPGALLATPGALAALGTHRVSLLSLLQRHLRGDWGDVSPDDAHANWQALVHGGRILSSYPLGPEVRLWLITEADRQATTALLPEEY